MKTIYRATKALFYNIHKATAVSSDLSVWNALDDEIDRIIYDDEYYKPDEKELRTRIEEEASAYLAMQEVEDIR